MTWETEETRATYDAVADEYASRHRDRTPIMDQVDRFLDLVDAGATAGPLLDLGCGPGWETAEFVRRGYRSLGVDVSRAFLARARETTSRDGSSETAGVDVAAMDMRSLALQPGSIVGVWACASVHHVPRGDVDRVFAELGRVLQHGGPLAVSVKRGSGTRTGDSYPGDERHFACYQPDAIRDRIEAAGFDVVDVVAGDDWVWVWARNQ